MITKIFRNGNSQAVRIPAELAFKNWKKERFYFGLKNCAPKS
ncbi:AbrB/MazE/SpoVT family DNA-binding domain-containing protein [Acidithiobacillus thiooxidans]|nr:AbrB/MazE/SpoVT family DNA-binding domain-containing protein [Acidithiobacillus sp. HP-11]MBU2751332.1 AbrB/MazE/SpoVT family DNA-binding domain-containing protein [Acidithiobacillus thiooxidans]MBU2791969.1 AbrB/MazE/SpoVT family DNA-binding domain-containing protein [Acidithiobacillus thiooxidans]MBU2812691.1 AbrB/MazE/SpoVT family DNA-binding domain-containing protein [Acidithiobacillus thiooxidans]MBU2840195.1 AbrB/MazE/SpoVT family DNA-binding domain-containing protein [Acidithiobacillu